MGVLVIMTAVPGSALFSDEVGELSFPFALGVFPVVDLEYMLPEPVVLLSRCASVADGS